MLRNKTFSKKNSRGKVVKVVTEHYLRDDIYCPVPNCLKCPSTGLKLDDLRNTTSPCGELVELPHYLIPDTNVVVNQLDLMDHLNNVILLSTVYQEVGHLSSNAALKVKNLISDPSRTVVSFSNEHHRETHVERLANESPNDRNDRAIRVAAQWFVKHLEPIPGVTVVVLTDDYDNREKARNLGLTAFSVTEYVKHLTGRPELIDLVADKVNMREKELVQHEEYISNLAMTTGIKNGTLYQGTLNISTHNYLEGTIFGTVDDKEQDIVILGRPHLNRAIHGDVVCVELLPRDQWGTSAVVITNEADEAQLDEPASAPVSEEDQKPRGKVVGIVKRNWRPYCGFIDKASVHGESGLESGGGPSRMVMFFPLDTRIPKLRMRTSQASKLLNQRILVAVDQWPSDSRYPMGHFVRALGEAGDKDTETEVLLLEHDVPHAVFAPNVLACLPSEGDAWVVQDEHVVGREDFRHLDICSIDPPGCTDIDDALHGRGLANGNFEVGVHIADVTHFVQPGTPMDREAANRCTSVYLVNRRIDMLPGLLGTNLCSLRSNVDRLAFSVIWELTPEAKVVSTRFTKSVIRSKASLTYEAAQKRLDDPTLTDEVTNGIRLLDKFANILRGRRMEAGALTLASPEVRFHLDFDSQDPVDVEMKALLSTNALVEEFMLFANISVAEKIYSTFPVCALLRSHPPPSPAQLEGLNRSLARIGAHLEFGSSKELADSLDRIDIPSDPYLNKLVRMLTTRCMMQARYISAGTVPYEEFHHYGLATPIYTHFTSPIRRYSDVIVHRLLLSSIDNSVPIDPALLNRSGMDQQCQTLNHRHRMAQQAARSSVELFTHLFFKDRTVYEEAYVVRVLKNGFIVLVPKYGIESIVHLTSFDTETQPTYIHDESENVLKFGEVEIAMFMKVQVKLSIRQRHTGGGEGGLRQNLAIHLVTPFIPNLSVSPPRSRSPTPDPLPGATKLRKLSIENGN